MENLLRSIMLWAGRATGLVGVLLCLLSFGTRMTGEFFVRNTPIGTILAASMALMMIGCLSYLAFIARLLQNRAAESFK